MGTAPDCVGERVPGFVAPDCGEEETERQRRVTRSATAYTTQFVREEDALMNLMDARPC